MTTNRKKTCLFVFYGPFFRLQCYLPHGLMPPQTAPPRNFKTGQSPHSSVTCGNAGSRTPILELAHGEPRGDGPSYLCFNKHIHSECPGLAAASGPKPHGAWAQKRCGTSKPVLRYLCQAQRQHTYAIETRHGKGRTFAPKTNVTDRALKLRNCPIISLDPMTLFHGHPTPCDDCVSGVGFYDSRSTVGCYLLE